ncbi:MAG: alpha/beta fold hydrolase [Verrucomicrobiota bacterium]
MSTLSQLRDRAEMLTPPLPWDRSRRSDIGGPQVVLLHGLWRGWRAMQPMARALQSEGFSTLNIPYPSGRLPIEVLAEQIRQQVVEISGDAPIHFITHSLGGILVRKLLEDGVPWKFGRIVMLAPPNHGSEIVDWTQQRPLLNRVLGPAGRALATDGIPVRLPPFPEGIQAGVIMGNRPTIPFFRRLLGEENDGIVSAQKGRIDGLQGFSIVNADHTFIQMHPEAIRLCVGFLKSGEWLDRITNR